MTDVSDTTKATRPRRVRVLEKFDFRHSRSHMEHFPVGAVVMAKRAVIDFAGDKLEILDDTTKRVDSAKEAPAPEPDPAADLANYKPRAPVTDK